MLVSDYARMLETAIEDLGLLRLGDWIDRLLQPNAFALADQQRSEFEALIFRARDGMQRHENDLAYQRAFDTFGLRGALTPQSVSTLTTYLRTKNTSADVLNDSQARATFLALRSSAAALVQAHSSLQDLVLSHRDKDATRDGAGVVEFVIYDFDGSGYSAGQIAKILIDLTELLDMLGDLAEPATRGQHRAKPRIAYAETGSDLLVGLLTTAAAAGAIVAICKAYYTVFFDLPQKARRVEAKTIQEELTTAGMIREAVEQGRMSEETARMWEEKIDAHVRRLTASGTMLRDYEPPVETRVRELVVGRREPGLLGPKTEEGDSDTSSGPKTS